MYGLGGRGGLPTHLDESAPLGKGKTGTLRTLELIHETLPPSLPPSLPLLQSTADVSEEEQIMQAIALSLGEHTAPEQKEEEKKAAREKEEEEKRKREQEEQRKREEEERVRLTPLDRSLLNDYCAR